MRKLAAAPAGVQKAIGQSRGAPTRRKRRSKKKRGMSAKQAKYFGKRKGKRRARRKR